MIAALVVLGLALIIGSGAALILEWRKSRRALSQATAGALLLFGPSGRLDIIPVGADPVAFWMLIGTVGLVGILIGVTAAERRGGYSVT